MIHRYMLFAGINYYPAGGWSDFRGNFKTVQAAEQHLLGKYVEWFQIVDRETNRIVRSWTDEDGPR